MDSFTILCIVAVYFLVGLFAQFAIFRKYERGEEDMSDKEIVSLQATIWLWPLVLIGATILFVSFALYFAGLVLYYSVKELFSSSC